MSIQITLNANEFQFTGTYNGHDYTSLQVKSSSNSRIYFTTIRNGMRLSEMAKQMKFENGNVYLPFGKQGKLIIGTYTDDSEVIEETPATIEEYKEDEKTLVDTFINEQYKIELLSSLDHHNPNYIYLGETCYKYHIVFTNIETGIINHELSDVVYLSKNAALKEIESHINVTNEHKEDTRIKPTQHKPINNIKESIPQIDMIANYADIQYKGNQVSIVFTNTNETNIVIYKYRKSWSHRKYIDKAIQQTGIKPSWEFRYGWKYVS